MMDPEKGRFRPISAEKAAEMQKELDTLAAQAPVERPARTRVLPILSEGEVLGLEIGGPVGTIEVQVDGIKANGKLFVHQTLLTVPGLAGTPVGRAIEIKGVNFRLRRVNKRGVAGLRMMTQVEVALWTQAGKPQPAWPVVAVTIVDPAPIEEIKVTCTLESPSKRAFPVSTDAQLRRAEQKERRLQGLAERRKANRERAERDQATLPASARLPESKIEQQHYTQQAIAARKKRKAEARAARKPQPPVDPAILKRARMVHTPDPSKVADRLLATVGIENAAK